MRSIAFALALLAAAPALAQSPAPAPAPAPAATADNPAAKFQAYATSDAYRKTIGQLAVMGDTVSAPECKTHQPKERAALTVFMPPMFGEGMHPTSGLWLDRIKMDRCGTITFQNILVQAQPNGQPPMLSLKMPGQTGANPPMQDLVMKDVVTALTKGKCTDIAKIIPVDSKVDKETKPRKVDQKGMLVEGAWKETWIFNACGKKVNATVDFVTDGKGGLSHKVKL